MFKLLVYTITLVSLQTAYGQNPFRISITKADVQPLLDKQLIAQMSGTGVSSPESLPIVYCPQSFPYHYKDDPSNYFHVVIENTSDTKIVITMSAFDWSNCISFSIISGNKTAVVSKAAPVFGRYNEVTRTFLPHTKQVFNIFFGEDNVYKWSGFPQVKTPVVVQMKANFTYTDKPPKWTTDYPATTGDDKNARKTVSSAPAPVILIGK